MAISWDQVAALSVQYSQFSFDYFLDSMEKCGITNIEFWPAEPHYYRDDYRSSSAAAKTIRQLRRKIDDRGMKVVMYTPETLGYPFNPAGHTLERERAIDMYKTAMEDALEFGTNRIFLNPGTGLRDEPREQAWQRSVDTFARVTEYGHSMGVEFYIEQLQPYESNLVTTSTELALLIKEIGASNLHAVLDIGAMVVAGDDIDGYFQQMPGNIGHVHFSDRNHEALGDQDLPLELYLDQLGSYGFSEYLSLEINDGMYLGDPHSPFLRSARWLQERLN